MPTKRRFTYRFQKSLPVFFILSHKGKKVPASKEGLGLLHKPRVHDIEGHTDRLQDGLTELVLVVFQPLNCLHSVCVSLLQLLEALDPDIVHLMELLFCLSGGEGGREGGGGREGEGGRGREEAGRDVQRQRWREEGRKESDSFPYFNNTLTF